jgi:hypothetical protein
MDKFNVKRSRLAKSAGVPSGCTRKIGQPDWDVRISTLRKLESVIPADFIFEPKKKPKKR